MGNVVVMGPSAPLLIVCVALWLLVLLCVSLIVVWVAVVVLMCGAGLMRMMSCNLWGFILECRYVGGLC